MAQPTHGLTETCSMCGTLFEVQFRYQMEERDGGFSFFCSQKCLTKSQWQESDGMATCDACLKRFRLELVSHILYFENRRKYACSSDCRKQLMDEAKGAKLGQFTPSSTSTEAPAATTFSDPRPKPVIPAQPVCNIPFPPTPQSQTAQPAPVQPRSCTANATTFAVFNHKGGTGKTTTSVNIAAGLAALGHRVLLVDTDAQGNVAVSLNRKADKTLYHVLVMGMPLGAVTQNVRKNLDLLPSNETLAAAELYLAGRQNRDRVLRERLVRATQVYDYVILDCSPSLSLLNQNALVFADNVLVPVACDYLSLVGVRQVIKTIRNVNHLLHHPVRLWGVLPTFYDARANICRQAVETLQKHFGERCLQPIRAAIKVKEAPAYGQTIFEFAAQSTAADDYQRVVEQIATLRQQQQTPYRAAATSA